MAEIEGIKASAKELAAMAEMGDEKALEKFFERSGAIFGRGLAVLIDLLNTGAYYCRLCVCQKPSFSGFSYV